MKDAFQIMDENLSQIIQLVQKDSYLESSRIGTYLIHAYVMMGYTDGVLIGEILENAFMQIGDIYNNFELDENTKLRMRNSLGQQLNIILYSYKTDVNATYNALKELRTVATSFQLYGWMGQKRKNIKE